MGSMLGTPSTCGEATRDSVSPHFLLARSPEGSLRGSFVSPPGTSHPASRPGQVCGLLFPPVSEGLSRLLTSPRVSLPNPFLSGVSVCALLPACRPWPQWLQGLPLHWTGATRNAAPALRASRSVKHWHTPGIAQETLLDMERLLRPWWWGWLCGLGLTHGARAPTGHLSGGLCAQPHMRRLGEIVPLPTRAL